MNVKRFLSILMLTIAALPAAAQEGMPPAPELTGEIIVEGLNSPQGVFVDSEGNLLVIDGGVGGDESIRAVDPTTFEAVRATYGNTSQILRRTPDGEVEVLALLPSIAVGVDFVGGGRVIEVDGVLYATVGAWQINSGETIEIPFYNQVVRIEDGEIETLSDLWAFELENNPDGSGNIESHPYGLTLGPDGLLYVADAASNTLYTVDPETGETTLLTAFEPLPGVFPDQFRDMQLLTDPVPTAVVVAEDGTIYVSLLSGAPFVPGSAKVVTVSEDGEVEDFDTGLTMLTDLVAGPDGNLYALSFATTDEQGPLPNSGAVVRVLEDGTSETIIAGLPFATGLAIDADGNGYVAINGIAIPEAGAVVYYEGLTEMEAVPAPEATPEG